MSASVVAKQQFLGQARASASTEHCMEIYDQWAATYDDEVNNEAQNYVAPTLVAQAALKASKNPYKSLILDAGCGTGLVGVALSLAGATGIDGVDLSPAMLAVAEKTGVYRNIAQVDLMRRIEQVDNTYDIVTCVGTFTSGHVGPDPALREFVRITKGNGIIASTILEEIWISGGFKTEIEKLQAENLVNVVTMELIDYVKGHGDKAMLVILEKIKHN